MKLALPISMVVAATVLIPAGSAVPGDHDGPLIGVVLSQRIEPYERTLAGFRKALGKIQPAVRYHLVDLEGAHALSPAAFVSGTDSRPDLYLVIGARAARALRSHDLRAPVIIASASDPQRRGDDREDTWASGVTAAFPYELQFQTLRAAAPRVRRVGTIYESGNSPLIVEATEAAKRVGLTLLGVEIRSVGEIPAALESLIRQVDALWAVPDATVYSQEMAPYIILQTLRHRIPFMSFSQNFVKAGSLLSLYPDFEDIGVQAGGMARDILSGRRPREGVLVPPRKALLAVNLRVADVIGLDIPADLRKRADAIYK